MNAKITEKEYNKLIQRLNFYDSKRNELLTFSFTSVLAILGVALAMDMNSVNAWLCLIPFCLIIPFSARISYYRLASAHITSFLKTFAQDEMQFEIGANEVAENNCQFYRLIAWLINHEMVLLGIASSCVFTMKYVSGIEAWSYFNYLSLIVPIVLPTFIFLISNTTYNYKTLLENFEQRWRSYLERKK